MMLDYFCDNPVYSPGLFRKRYRNAEVSDVVYYGEGCST